jgi:hypothetical protein
MFNAYWLASLAPTLSRPEYKYAPVSKDQTQSHLHSQQVNAKSTSNSTRGLLASHSATTLRTYDHWAGSPRNGHFKSTSLVVSQVGAQKSANETYDHPACPPRNGRFQQRRPTTIQRVPHMMGTFRKEDLRLSSMSSMQWARFKSTPAVRCKRPFSESTATGVCPCNDSREQWC